MAISEQAITIAVDQPQPTPPMAGMPSAGWPWMKSQLSATLMASMDSPMNIAGRVQDMPSHRQRRAT